MCDFDSLFCQIGSDTCIGLLSIINFVILYVSKSYKLIPYIYLQYGICLRPTDMHTRIALYSKNTFCMY